MSKTKFLFKVDRTRVYWHTGGKFSVQEAGLILQTKVRLADLPYNLQHDTQVSAIDKRLSTG